MSWQMGCNGDELGLLSTHQQKKKNIPCCQTTQNVSFGNRVEWGGMVVNKIKIGKKITLLPNDTKHIIWE